MPYAATQQLPTASLACPGHYPLEQSISCGSECTFSQCVSLTGGYVPVQETHVQNQRSLKNDMKVPLKKQQPQNRILPLKRNKKIPQNAQYLPLQFHRSMTLDRFKSSPASDVPVLLGTPGRPVTCLFSFTLESPWVPENFLDGYNVSRQSQCV